jgi:hypothetical protein
MGKTEQWISYLGSYDLYPKRMKHKGVNYYVFTKQERGITAYIYSLALLSIFIFLLSVLVNTIYVNNGIREYMPL